MHRRSLRRATAWLVLKLAVAASACASLWILRDFPWWVLLVCAVNILVFTTSAVRTFRREREAAAARDALPPRAD